MGYTVYGTYLEAGSGWKNLAFRVKLSAEGGDTLFVTRATAGVAGFGRRDSKATWMAAAVADHKFTKRFRILLLTDYRRLVLDGGSPSWSAEVGLKGGFDGGVQQLHASL